MPVRLSGRADEAQESGTNAVVEGSQHNETQSETYRYIKTVHQQLLSQ
jgi:hypothetical protein